MIVQDGVQDEVAYDSNLEVLRCRNFVDRSEAQLLLQWALRMEPYLRNNGPGRAFLRIHLLPEQNPLHAAMVERVRQAIIGPASSVIEPGLTNYLSIISAGGAVHPHTDAAPEGTRHLRCNMFLQIPDSGGRPVIGGHAFDVAERSLLCFFPSSHLHSSEPVTGTCKRVLLSFGFLVPGGFRFNGLHG